MFSVFIDNRKSSINSSCFEMNMLSFCVTFSSRTFSVLTSLCSVFFLLLTIIPSLFPVRYFTVSPFHFRSRFLFQLISSSIGQAFHISESETRGEVDKSVAA